MRKRGTRDRSIRQDGKVAKRIVEENQDSGAWACLLCHLCTVLHQMQLGAEKLVEGNFSKLNS